MAELVTQAEQVRPVRTGVVTGSYDTQAGDRVWLIDWDDGRKTPPQYIVTEPDEFRPGERVQLAGDRLERLR